MSLQRNLVLYYNLQGNANDVSGNNNTGVSSNVTYNTTNGKIDEGGGFNATTSQIQKTSSSIPAGNNEITMTCWCKLTTNPGNFPVVSVFSTTQTPGSSMAFFLDASNRLCLGFGGGGSSITGIGINDGLWHFCVGWYNKTSARLYIDNILRGSLNTTLTFGNSTFEVGWLSSSTLTNKQRWVGSIDEVSVWTRALSTTELSLLWNNGNGLTYPFFNTSLLFNLL